MNVGIEHLLDTKPAVYRLVMTGQGDTYISFVPKDVYDWILMDETPGREGDASRWIDTGAPQSVVDKAASHKDGPFDLSVTIGSYWNDRAIHAAELFPSFFDHDEADAYVRENGLIVMETWEGYIY